VRHRVVVALAVLLPGACSSRPPDHEIKAAVDAVRAIDNHVHVVAPDLEHDTGYDALPCDGLPPATARPPANLRFGPDLKSAWQALYGFAGESDAPETIRQWQASQRSVRERHGAEYFDWVLEQAGFDIALANRVSMPPALDARHFRWVPYDDALLVPIDNSARKAESPDRKVLYEDEERLLKSYMSDVGVTSLPPTLDAYVTTILGPTLQSQKSKGAVAIKFEVAYLRALDFEIVPHDLAADVYARSRRGSPINGPEYKALQDFLFHEIAQRAGPLGLVIHIHTGAGCGEYFDVRGSDPLLLERMLDDPALRATRFVLLHGGSPFERHNLSLIQKPNVWVDTSMLELMFSPAELARILRPWLEAMPEHVLFGTDAGPSGPGMGWEETTWMASRRARQALTIALTEMVQDEVITTARAKEIAEAVLRSNALELYGWK
jgi:predicted TIM-barrel fold metal-dependent hydrolase